MRDYIKRWISVRGFCTLGLMLFVNTVAYMGTRLVTGGMHHMTFWGKIDDIIPFCSWFVFFYVIAYLQWGIGFFLLAREETEISQQWLWGEIIAKCFCMICFLILPTTMVRAEITGSGIWDELTGWIYRIDAADNLFPSIHCLESYILLRAAFTMEKIEHKHLFRTVQVTLSILVCASTVLIKQHVFVDILGAITVAEMGYSIAGYLLEKRNRGMNEEKQNTVGAVIPDHSRS